MKKLLLSSALALVALCSMAQSAEDYGIVMTQPAGELKTYDRAGYSYYLYNDYVRRGAQTGTIDIVFGEDNKVYLKQPLAKLEISSWVEGTLSDDGKTITLPLNQNIAYDSEAEQPLKLAVLDYDEDYEEFEVRNSAKSVTYSVTDTKISLVGTSRSVVLGAVTATSNEWGGYADYSSVYTPTTSADDVLITPPASLQTDTYKFTGTDYSSGATLNYNVLLGLDGNDMYIKGIFGDLPEVWVKGTKNGNTVTFAHGQYLGLQANKPYYMVGTSANASGTQEVVDFALNYDADTDTYTNACDYLVMNTTKNTVYLTQAINNIVITKDANGGVKEVPYYETFDTQAAFNEFTVINANGDNRTWEFSGLSQNVSYAWSTTSAADDWLITPPVHLLANTAYTFSIVAKGMGETERLEVKAGTEPTVEAMTMSVVNATEITGSSETTIEGLIIVEEEGNYNIGIHCISDANMFMLTLDNLSVENRWPTAIETIGSDKNNADNNYYDLSGRKVNAANLPAGIYIHQGKKVIVK